MDSTDKSTEGVTRRRKIREPSSDSAGGARDARYAPPSKRVLRNPFDAASFPVEQVTAGGESFPDLFEPGEVADEGATGEELRHVFAFLETLITRELERRTAPRTLVKLVKMNISS